MKGGGSLIRLVANGCGSEEQTGVCRREGVPELEGVETLSRGGGRAETPSFCMQTKREKGAGGERERKRKVFGLEG